MAGSSRRNRASKSSASEPPADAETAVWQRALRLLAARERSAAELAARLRTVGGTDAAVEAVLERLRARGYLDDGRVAQHAAQQAVRRGRGSIYARAQLTARGVAPALIDAAIRDHFTDEATLAGTVLVRRYASPPLSPAERARAARFLLHRGFPRAVVLAILGEGC